MAECYSRDEECFTETNEMDIVWEIISDQTSPSEAIGYTYYKGESYKPSPSSLFNMDRMAEDMQERAYDEYGEWAEDYLAGENLYELQKIIETWLDDNIPVSFFAVKDVVQKSVTKEMVEEYLKENV